MLQLKEAREIQRKREKKAGMRFAVCFCFSLLVLLGSFFCARFCTGMFLFEGGIAVSVLFLLWQARRTKIYLFFSPKEYAATVQHYEVRTEPVKESLSHLVGETYRTHDETVGEMVVTDQKGRVKTKRFLYSPAYDKIGIGDTVILLRFIDRPVWEKAV